MATGQAGIVVRLESTLAELRALVSVDRPIDHARCMRLLLQATSNIPDPRRAADLLEEARLLIPSIDLADILGSERQYGVDEFMALLQDIEELAGADRA